MAIYYLKLQEVETNFVNTLALIFISTPLDFRKWESLESSLALKTGVDALLSQ